MLQRDVLISAWLDRSSRLADRQGGYFPCLRSGRTPRLGQIKENGPRVRHTLPFPRPEPFHLKANSRESHPF